jgi:hypothetical protein
VVLSDCICESTIQQVHFFFSKLLYGIAATLDTMTAVMCRQKPSLELQRENERLTADCKRLVAIVEQSAEFQKFNRKSAALRGVHFLPASECLAAESIVSAVYQPDRDREVCNCCLLQTVDAPKCNPALVHKSWVHDPRV